jgi:uncharacterized protein (TIGR02145 family)
MAKLVKFISVSFFFFSTTQLFAQYGCNDSIPILGENLGEITFKTNQIWIIGNQEWSDVVITSACRKESFNGGDFWQTKEGATSMIFNTDCRSNESYGDLFSWCTVVRFQNELCPAPWRVPMSEDFRDLDIALGGTGKSRGDKWSSLSFSDEQLGLDFDMLDSLRKTIWKEEVEVEIQFINENYLGRWGGVLGGDCNSWGKLFGQGSSGCYWSTTELGTNAVNLHFDASLGLIEPRRGSYKDNGAMLRCVRCKSNQNEEK